jgi:hypothetical protein
MRSRHQGPPRSPSLHTGAWICALIIALLAAPLGCQPSGGAPAQGGSANVPASAQQADAVLDAVARYLPASTFVVASFDLSLLGQGYGALFTDGLGMTRSEYDAMIKDVNDFILTRVGWTVTDVRWAFVGVSERKEVVLIVRADAQIQRGLEPIPGSAGLKGLRFEDIVIVPLAEQGLYAVLFDDASVSWFAERKETLDSAAGKPRLALLNGMLQKGAKNTLFSAAVALDSDAKPIKKLRRDMPPPLQKIKGASASMGDSLSLVMHGDNQDLQAINALIKTLVDQGEQELKSAREKIAKAETAEGLAIIAASHLIQPIARTFTPKIEGDFSFIRFEGDSANPMGALAGVWVVGVLAAVAVPAFLTYIKDSKSAEAKLNLKWIGDGALTFSSSVNYDPSPADLTAAGSAAPSSRNHYPIVAKKVCTSSGGSLEQKSVPNMTDFESSPWRELRFTINKPHFYTYCYESSPDGSTFKATAFTSKDPQFSGYQIQGAINTSNGYSEPIISSVEEFYP